MATLALRCGSTMRFHAKVEDGDTDSVNAIYGLDIDRHVATSDA